MKRILDSEPRMLSPELTDLLDHMEWADALMWHAVAATPDAADDHRLRELLHHVHQVQQVYVRVLQDAPIELGEADTFTDLDAIRDWGWAVHAELRALRPALDDAALERNVTFPWAAELARSGMVHPTSGRRALLQVTSHSTYHRGQISTRIRTLGGEPVLTDFVVWVWRGRPAAEWPARTRRAHG